MSDDSKIPLPPRDVENGQFARRLHALADRVFKGEIDYEHVMSAIQWLLDSLRLTPYSLMPHPRVQLGMIKMFNSVCRLGINPFVFHRVEGFGFPRACIIQNLRPTQAYVLDVVLGDESKKTSVNVAGDLICKAQGLSTSVFSENFHLLNREGPFKDLSWRIVDFSPKPNRNFSVTHLRNEEREKAGGHLDLPSTAILWALVYNPNLLKDLREFGVKSLWAGGFTNKQGDRLPVFKFDNQFKKLEILGGHPGHGGDEWTIPTFAPEPV